MFQLIQNKYFGNITYYKNIVGETDVIIAAYVAYQKSLNLNRTVISGANGPIMLTIPLIKGRDQRTPYGGVTVAYEENWRKDHWKAILSSYNKSPWFEYYHDELAAFYSNRFDLLFEWNFESWKIVNRILGLSPTISVADQRESPTQPFQLIERHDEVEVQQEKPLKSYPQVFDDRFGFIPNLSILDLVFCLGPREAFSYLTST